MHLPRRTCSQLAIAALLATGTLLSAPAASAQAASTVTNGGFEADGTGTATPSGWSTQQTSGTGNASYTEAGGHPAATG